MDPGRYCVLPSYPRISFVSEYPLTLSCDSPRGDRRTVSRDLQKILKLVRVTETERASNGFLKFPKIPFRNYFARRCFLHLRELDV